MKLELGINTDFQGEFDQNEQMEEKLAQIAAAGFTHIHWCWEWDGDYQYARAEMEQIRGWMDRYGLKAKSLHASKGSRRAVKTYGEVHYRKDYTSDSEPNRIAGVELIKNRVELSHVLGGSEIVLHMYLPYQSFEQDPETKERFYAQTFKSLDELQPFCREQKVRICIENLFEAPAELQIEQFDRLFERYPADFLGLCLDTGHANLVGGNEFAQKLASRYSDRLYSLHLNDNRGWGKEPGCGDAHQLPGECALDWAPLMSILKKSAYEQPFVMEVMKPGPEDTEHYLKRAYEAGVWMVNQG
ncbi:MAG: sugar phosphate isomerase/epimerase family protein [Eubacteriales bacterium]|nr:sugar phosphate isomerase/epimerase family protein [Eubacteriales bacterium]